MNAYLFNLLQKLRQVRDEVLAQGPGDLRSLSAMLARASELAIQVAQYIENLGPSAAAVTAGEGSQAQVGQYLTEIQNIQGELQAFVGQQQPEPAAAPGGGEQNSLMDWINKINPDTRKMITDIVLKLITGALLKSGVGLQQPAAGQSPQTPRR